MAVILICPLVQGISYFYYLGKEPTSNRLTSSIPISRLRWVILGNLVMEHHTHERRLQPTPL